MGMAKFSVRIRIMVRVKTWFSFKVRGIIRF